ncbi:hypothetical protein BsWGS_04011 [Bradybaena similaris]
MLFATALCLGLLHLVQGQCVYKTVAFSAALREDRYIPANELIVYDYVITNYGRAYDNSTGVFVSPTEAIYGFHFHAVAVQGQEFWLRLYHNDNYIVSAYGKQSVDYAAAGNSVMLRLQEGDRVYIRAHRNTNLYGVSNNIYTTFSGHIVGVTSL